MQKFMSKLGEAFTRALVLVLALSILIPAEVISVFDFSEFGLGTTHGYASGGSGSIGTGEYADAGIKSFSSGFKIGLQFGQDFYINPDTEYTIDRFDDANGYYRSITHSIFLLPATAEGYRPNWQERAWSVGYYAGNSKIKYFGVGEKGTLFFTRGRNSKSSGYTNGIFYNTIIEQLRTDYDKFTSGGWRTLLSQVGAQRNACLDNWEYITGWDGNGTYHIQERINKCFGWDILSYDNFDSWKNDDDKRLQNMARYADMLMQLYAIENNPGGAFSGQVADALNILFSGEFKSQPFTLEMMPNISIVGAPGTDILLTTSIEFIQGYLGINTNNRFMDWPVISQIRAGKYSGVRGSAYGIIKTVTAQDLVDFSGASRVSNWTWISGKNAYSWGISGMTPGRMHTRDLKKVDWTWSSKSTGRSLQQLWLDHDEPNADYTNKIQDGIMYGISYVHYIDTPLKKATIGKIEALPDNYPVNPNQSNGSLGKDVDVLIHSNVKSESNKSAWEAIFADAETAIANGTFDGAFDLYIKVTRACDYAPWSGIPADWQDTTYATGELNKTLTLDQLKQFIQGNMDISENVDFTSGYTLQLKEGEGYNVTFTYTADLQLKADTNGDGQEEIYGPASENDKMDTASFIIPAKQPDRLRYVSTPEAYAELKNYGDGSNQSGNLSEDYEAMAGLPTTEQLYYAAGGSEFIVDLSFEHCKDEKSIRSYTSYIAGTNCEYHGVGKDGMTTKQTGTYSESGTVGGDITGSWSVSTSDNSIVCGCDVCSGGGACGAGGDWTVSITASYSNECFYHTCAGGENSQIITNGSGAYNAMCAAIAKIKSQMDADATAFTYTASSDGVTRTGKGFSWTANPGHNTPDGSDGVKGCGGPHDHCGTCCSGHSVSDGKGGTKTVRDGCGNACVGSSCNSGSQGSGGGTITGTWTPHYICGPCCSHHLPDIYDTWSQSWTYDTLKIIDAHVWRIDQAAAKDLSTVIGPAVDNKVKYTAGAVAGTYGPYDNPNGLNDGIVGASLKAGIPNVFYNIAMKNSNNLPGHSKNLTFKEQDGIGDATESSVVGRIRYNLNGTWADADQHDMVYYDLGTRTNKCDGKAKTRPDNQSPAGGGGHAEKWAPGFLYSAYTGTATHHGHNSSAVNANDVATTASKGSNLDGTATNYWKSTQWNKAGQTLYPLDDVYFLQEHCDGNDGSSIDINGGSADTSSNEGRLDVNTQEYAKLLEKRNQPMQATMVSDYMILQTTSGDQSLLYYQFESDTIGYYNKGSNTQQLQYNEDGTKKAVPGVAKQITAETMIPTVKIPQEFLWENNPLSSAKWAPDEINVGGYNGKYTQPSQKFKGTGNNEQIETLYDRDPAGAIVRPARPARGLMLYSLPLNIITEDHNESYLTSNIESEVFWANNIHWSDETAKAMFINMNPLFPDYSVTDEVGDTDNYKFSNLKDLITTWGQKDQDETHSYTGIIEDTKYSENHDIELNGLIIQDPISTSEVALISLPDERDQRYASTIDAGIVNDIMNKNLVCPGTAADCEFAVLNCKYGEDKTLAEYYFNNNTGINSITKNDLGSLPKGWTIANNKLVANSPAVRISIPLSDELGMEYQSSTRFRVTADVTLNEIPKYTNSTDGTLKSRISQMLYGFSTYGIYVGVDGAIGIINEDGQYREATNIKLTTGKTYNIEVIIGMNSMNSCEITVDGVKAVFTNSALSRQQFNSGDVGGYFNIGAMSKSTYGPRATYDNIVIEKMGGTYAHTEDCYILQMIHPSGINAHEHTIDCIVSGTVVDTNPGNPITYNYTGGIQSVTLQPGSYKLEVWGAQGGGSSTYGGKGGYAVGTIKLTSPTTLYIVVGGQGGNGQSTSNGGYNGGGYSAAYGGGGGGATHIATASGLLKNLSNNKSSVLLVAGGGGGWAGTGDRSGGDGGGTSGGDGYNGCGGKGYGGTQVAGGTSGRNGSVAGFGYGGNQTAFGSNGGAGGGGGWYGGGAGGNDYSRYHDNDDSGGGGGSGYINTSELTSTSMSSGQRTGNGMAKITPLQTTNYIGYDKYKEMYERGELTIEDLKRIFGDAYEILFNNPSSYLKFTNFTSTNGFVDFVNCDLKTYSGDLVESITGTGPSFTLSRNIDAHQVLKIDMNISNNTTAKKAKIYWTTNGIYTEANSMTVSIDPMTANQVVSFAVGTKASWTGNITKVKFCIPAETDKNYGSNILISAIDFVYANPDPVTYKYSSSVKSYTATVSGYYLLEVWGASGGNNGGLGGYTKAVAKLNAGQKLYVYTGGKGTASTKLGTGGGTNGGGHGATGGAGGGGMTHISSSPNDKIRSTVNTVTVDKGHWELDPTAGTILGSDDDSGGRLSARLYVNLTAGQQYLFSVGRFSSSRTGSYPYYVYDPHGNLIMSGTDYCDEGAWSNKTYDPDCVHPFTAQYTGQYRFEASANGGDPCVYVSTYAKVWKPVWVTENQITTSITFDPMQSYVIAGGGGGMAGGGVGGGTSGGNGKIGSSAVANTGGTASQGFAHGMGGSATIDTNTGGAGGGFYGGKATNSAGSSGGGGSGFINTANVMSYTDSNGVAYTAKTKSGVNKGNGKAKITFIEASPGEWPTKDEILNVIDKIPGDSPIFGCNRTPNVHVCDSMCKESEVLKCNEPHHSGNHYAGSDICYDPCLDDAKHKHTVEINTATGEFNPGNFINIDWGFNIYYNNIGDFYQSNTHGIGNLTNTRGMGYVNDTDTSTWTRVKQVKFNVNVIYQGNLYLAGEWVTLADKGEYLGLDGSPYDERNWSHYDTQLYDDLHGNLIDGVRDHLYEFYCVEGNTEQAGSIVEFRAFAINNPEYDSDCNDMSGYPNYVTNGPRAGKRFESKHSAYNILAIDVVGRIGNLALIDTGDYRYSNLFKKVVASDIDVEEPDYYTVVDGELEPNNGAVIRGDRIESITAGGGAVLKDLELPAGAYRIYVKGDKLSSSGLSIKAEASWGTDATITEAEGLNTVVTTENPGPDNDLESPIKVTKVSGPNVALKAGENTIQLRGQNLAKANWTLKSNEYADLSQFITGKTLTDGAITWTLDLPKSITGFEVLTEYRSFDTIKAEVLEVYRINTDESKELAYSDHITNITVSDNLRVYYVQISVPTKVEISAISRGIPISVDAIGVQFVGEQDENWTVEGIVRNVDESRQNAYLTWKFDIRGLPMSKETQYIDTYNTLEWAQTARCMTSLPLTPDQNSIEVLKDEALLVGYDLYASIGTIGDYYMDGSGFLQLIPEYYGIDIRTGEFFPVDAYIFYDNSYYPINIWGLITGEDKYTWGGDGSGYDLSTIYNFATVLRWGQEKVRRMVTPAEEYQTQYLRDLLATPLDDEGNAWDYLDTPSGNNYVMGNAQFLQLNGNARTFVGGETTYSELMNYTPGTKLRTHLFDDEQTSGRLYEIGSGKNLSSVTQDENEIWRNPAGKLEASEWWRKAQRWHLTLGLASSSVFVRSGLDPTTENIAELQTKDFLILSTVDIRVLGAVWNLIYTQENGSIRVTDENGMVVEYDIPEKIMVNGHEHAIPPALVIYQTIKNSPFDVDIISNY